MTKLTVPIVAEGTGHGTGPEKALNRTCYWAEHGIGKCMVLHRAGHRAMARGRAGNGHGQDMARVRAWQGGGHGAGQGIGLGRVWQWARHGTGLGQFLEETE